MKRDKRIDIVRGLSMVLIVLGHSGFPKTSYIYLFHVSVFFIIAGWCWKEQYSEGSDGLKLFLKRKIHSLYFPYVAWMSGYTLLHNLFIKINIYSQDELFLEGEVGNQFGLVFSYDEVDYIKHEIRNILFVGSEPLAGASWFLRILFYVMILWTGIDYLLKRNITNIHIVRLVIATFLFAVGNFLRINNILLPDNISTVFSVYIFFWFGVYLRKMMDQPKIQSESRTICRILIIVGCVMFLEMLNHFGNIEISMNQYSSGLFLIVCSISGWLLLVEIALLIEKYQISRLFCFIGESTIWILFLHFAAFKFINVLQVYIYNLPVYRIASYPTLITDKGWWIIYTIVGVFIPLLVKQLVKKLRRCVQQFIMNNYVIHL